MFSYVSLKKLRHYVFNMHRQNYRDYNKKTAYRSIIDIFADFLYKEIGIRLLIYFNNKISS